MRTPGNFAGLPAYFKIGLSGSGAASYNCHTNNKNNEAAKKTPTTTQSDRQILGGVQPYCACQDAWCNTNYKSGVCNAMCVDRLRPRQGNSRGMDSPAQAQAIM